MVLPKLDFLDSAQANAAKPAKATPDSSRFSLFSQGERRETHSRIGIPNTNPPPDRPIQDNAAAWLLTLTETERQLWWRDVACRFNRCNDWAQAEDEATTARRGLPIPTKDG